jgi:hypothetical protein
MKPRPLSSPRSSRQTAIPGSGVDDLALELVDKPTGVKGSARGLVHRRRKAELDRVTSYLPKAIGEKLRAHCASRRIEMSTVVADALERFFGGGAALLTTATLERLAERAEALELSASEAAETAAKEWIARNELAARKRR